MKAAPILKRAQKELAGHEAGIPAHAAEISTHEKEFAETDPELIRPGIPLQPPTYSRHG
jgi:hypothetical protein